ncbi:MAG: hypothetical protein AB7H77_05040 [Bdellovibrionales bacterium]
MKRLKNALENLDEQISALEDRVGVDNSMRQGILKKNAEQLKQSQRREASVLAVAQKVATRLDQAIEHVEKVLRD